MTAVRFVAVWVGLVVAAWGLVIGPFWLLLTHPAWLIYLVGGIGIVVAGWWAVRMTPRRPGQPCTDPDCRVCG